MAGNRRNNQADADRESPLLKGDGTIDPSIALDSLKEILPSFVMEHLDFQEKDNNRGAVHRASFVFTPIPSCRVETKKIILPLETPPSSKSKKNKQVRSPSRLTTTDEHPAVPFPEADETHEEPGLAMKVELLRLQSQVEQLKIKVRDKEVILQSIRQSDARVLEQVERAESAVLRCKVEELQKELMKKDFLYQCSQLQLAEKKEEIAHMKQLVQGLNSEIERKNFQLSNAERDLACLQVLSQFGGMYSDSPVQPKGTMSREPVSHVGWFPTTDDDEDELVVDQTVVEMETAREQYLAAVSQAKSKPIDENIQLAAELRRQLEEFVSRSL